MSDQQVPENQEPEETLAITDIETLKVVADPLRLDMIDLLRTAPHTVKQLAAALDLPLKKLYYHINLLEEHGLIKVVDTRVVSGIIEKQYRAAAYLFLFDKVLFMRSTAPDDLELPPGLQFMFDSTRLQLKQSVRNNLVELSSTAPIDKRPFLSWDLSHMTPQQAERFYSKLAALMLEFPIQQQSDPNAQVYRMFMAVFPIQHPHLPEKPSDKE